MPYKSKKDIKDKKNEIKQNKSDDDDNKENLFERIDNALKMYYENITIDLADN